MDNIKLSSLDGITGFIIPGLEQDSRLGDAVSGAGDINGDGIADIIIGAKDADVNGNNSAGKIYVIFGQKTSFSSSFDLSNLNGNNGFVINGIDAEDFAGISVSNAGDINQDGVDDLIIGARGADPNGNNNAGESYVVFGKQDGFTTGSLNLANLDGNNGFTINGIDSGDFSGTSVSSAGDVNGDGVDDLIIGANFANSNAGESYVVFGKQDGFTTGSLNLADLNGSNGFTINGIKTDDNSSISVSSAGDINGDGFSDLIIGAINADPNERENAGEAYVIFGKDEEFASNFDLSTLNGSNGFVIRGASVDNLLGTSVSSAGDFNGDRLDDIIVSAVGADGETGASYLLFGSKRQFKEVIDLHELRPNEGFTIEGIETGDRSGNSVSGAGDVNGDGFDDLIIGAPEADPNNIRNAGESYIIYGKVALVGDADGDLLYTGKDINAISRFVVGLDSEFSAFPDINPLLVADMNKDGTISSLDAALVANLVYDV